MVLLISGCDADGGFRAKDGDPGNGMVNVRIALDVSENRMALYTDTPIKNYVDYYEAVFRETVTGNYYRAEARRGYSYILISVLPNKNYDILLLAGITAEGQKVLLASGWVPDCRVSNGENSIAVPMTIHKTSGGFENDASQFIYKPRISGIGGLIAAGIAAGNSLDISQTEAYWSGPGLPDAPVSIAGSVLGADALSLTFGGISRSAAPLPDTNYLIYFDAPYRAFSDYADPLKTLWHIRRGFTHTLDVLGGAALIQHTVRDDLYFVSQYGDDANDGKSTATPFKTPGKAAQVIGSLAAPPADIYVNVISHLSASPPNTGTAFTITDGKAGTAIHFIGAYHIPDAPPYITIETLNQSNSRVLSVYGSNLKAVFENIIITRGRGVDGDGGGFYIYGGAEVILGQGAQVKSNRIFGSNSNGVGRGAGIFITDAQLSLKSGAVIENNGVSNVGASQGNGLFIGFGGTVTLTGGIIRNNRSNGWSGYTGNLGGGAYVANGGTFTVHSGEMSGNSSGNGNAHTVFAEIGSAVHIPGIHAGTVAGADWAYNADITVP
ncbi:MAG: hypothetical protein LBG87_01440 [Spirochaetaceae bacterium]|nr:hypothetical protein [Spirochaetaceae bacterium]